MVSTSIIHVNTWITTYLPIPDGLKASLAYSWLTHMDSLSTKWSPVIDWAQGSKSPPDKDRHPNHLATRPTSSDAFTWMITWSFLDFA